MRVFYENIVGTIENLYLDKATLENVLYLEDIVGNVTTDIYVQFRDKTHSQITYTYGSIDLGGSIKIRNHLYFVNYYRSTYNDFLSIETNTDNVVEIRVTNVDISEGDLLTADIYVNDTKVETLSYSDEYTLYNRDSIQIDSESLGTSITISLPLNLAVNEYVKYKVYSINVTEEPSMHKYLCTFDRVNNALIFDRKYKDPVITILAQSKGSILRSSTINELYRVNVNSFVQYDENNGRISIPLEKIFKDETKLKYIKTQYVEIDPLQLQVGYNLLGIYLDSNDYLVIDNITANPNYATLMESINNYNLDTARKERQYYGFIVGLNNITSFIPTDINLYGLGAGNGGGTGGVEKIMHDFTNVDEITIEYVAGTEVPTVTIFDNDGYQIVPQETHYNFSDEIVITLGELVTGLVSVI